MQRSRRGRVATSIVALMCAFLALTGCSLAIDGSPVASGAAVARLAPPTPLPADDLDRFTLQAAEEVEAYWRQTFPAEFGRPWIDIMFMQGVDPRAASGLTPPCVDSIAEVTDNAFYCPSADAIVWDSGTLFPKLNQDYGAVGPVVVVAHEIGHALQNRLGVSQAARVDRVRFPTILLEAQADCYAGVVIAEFAERPIADLEIEASNRDAALLAMINFRDPLGVSAGDPNAHGNAFDRVSAFQDGFLSGPRTCANMTVDNRAFTQRLFTSAADAANQGNLPLPDLLTAVEADARAFFGTIGQNLAPGWEPPTLLPQPGTACQARELRAQGPVSFCPADGSIAVDPGEITPVHRGTGDYAAGVLVASRYALALWAARGGDPNGPEAGKAAVCLSGAYTARLLDATGDFSLSPGDLDEAIQVLVTESFAARDARGNAARGDHGFERVTTFRAGAQGGVSACLPS